jgi:hypothetical protein
MLRVLNFFAINATSMSNLLDDNHRTYSNFLQILRQRWIVSKMTAPGCEPTFSDLQYLLA